MCTSVTNQFNIFTICSQYDDSGC